ncbi:MAG: hypothetical protein ABIB47_04620 [Candidatus Woesearchaeota archaeon]
MPTQANYLLVCFSPEKAELLKRERGNGGEKKGFVGFLDDRVKAGVLDSFTELSPGEIQEALPIIGGNPDEIRGIAPDLFHAPKPVPSTPSLVYWVKVNDKEKLVATQEPIPDRPGALETSWPGFISRYGLQVRTLGPLFDSANFTY